MGKIASIVLVHLTAAGQIAHAAECLARRHNFAPKVMYSDIWPYGREFWKLIFGVQLMGQLGLFHFMKKIIQCLQDSHANYRLAIWWTIANVQAAPTIQSHYILQKNLHLCQMGFGIHT
jgi:hypothetical protein